MKQEIKFTPCKWEEIHPYAEKYIKENNITVESYWEDHVLSSNHYKITCDKETAGYFAVNGGSTVVLFNVFAPYADQAQEIFHQVKKYEQIICAMVPTGDEFFMSHCLDNFARLEKQAYFAIYTEKEIPEERRKPLEFRAFDMERDIELLKQSGLFPDSEMDKVYNRVEHMEILIAEMNGEEVGFGVIEYGRVVKDIASIGMFVHERFRRQGIAANILQGLKHIVQGKGFRAFSGCWYYNHNSKKSIESAGAYTKTRLIKFYF